MFPFLRWSLAATLVVVWIGCRAVRAGQEEDRQEYLQLIRRVLAELDEGQFTQMEVDSKRMVTLTSRSFPNNLLMIAPAQQFLAIAYDNQGRYAEAEALYKRTVPIVERVAGSEHEMMAELLTNLGLSYWRQGRFAEAEPVLKRALVIWQRRMPPNHAETGQLLNNLALVYTAQGKNAEAEPLYLRAIQIGEANYGPEHPEVASRLNNLAVLYQNMEDYPKAVSMHERALRIREKTLRPDHPDLAKSLNNLASIYETQGKYTQAEPLYRRALTVEEQAVGPNHPDVAPVLDNLGNVATRLGKFAEGESLIERAIGIATKSGGEPMVQFKCFRDRALLRWQTDRRDEAIDDLQQALQVGENMRANIAGADKERADFFSSFSWAYERLVSWQFALNRPDQALNAAERCRARGLVDQLNAQGTDLLAGLSPQVAARLKYADAAARSKVASLEKQLDLLATRKDLSESQLKNEDARLQADLDAAREEVVEAYRALRNASPAYRLMVGQDFQPVALQTLQTWLKSQQALLIEYFLGDERGYLFVIDPETGLRIETLEVPKELAKDLAIDAGPLTADRLKAALSIEGRELPQLLSQATDNPGIKQRLAALWKVLIPEAQRRSLTNGTFRRLLVVPDGGLANLPFDALIVEAGDEPVYLLDVGPPLAVGPSATLLYNLSKREAVGVGRAARGVLTVGNPSYSKQPISATAGSNQSAGSASDLLASFKPAARYASRGQLQSLPYTGWESSWVNEAFTKVGIPVEALQKTDATEAKVRQQASWRRLIHLACHGLVDSEYGNFFGALALTPGARAGGNAADDGFLTLPEIYELNLKGNELAILSACQTNYGPQQRGEGVWALSRGFLVAGSRRVVASNWLVDDEAAASLIYYFCTSVAREEKAEGGSGKAEIEQTDRQSTSNSGSDPTVDYAKALHDAKLSIRHKAKWQHPYYWATFTLIGPN